MSDSSVTNPDSDAGPDPLGRTIEPGDVTMAHVRAALDRWREVKGSRACPTRDDFAPRHIAKMLPFVTLFRCLPDEGDYEVRIMGGVAVEAHGFNATGWRTGQFEAVYPGYGTTVRAALGHVCAAREPICSAGRLSHVNREFSLYELVMLPLAADGETVDHILVIAQYAIDPLKRS